VTIAGAAPVPRRAVLAALALGAWTPARADDALKAAIGGAHRTPAFVARDAWRHPAETLAFFGLRPEMTVVEINPGAGWYTEILAPILRDRGRLLLAAPSLQSDSAYERQSAERLQRKLQARPDLYDRVQLVAFEPPRRVQLAPAGSADLVLTFRNVHNWAALGDDVVRAVFQGAAASLKPGGTFGVVDHRLPAGRPPSPQARSGYLHEAYVIRLAESTGFALRARSEINANPRDSADHEGGVWALPPSLANKDRDRQRYLAIGESDRMTLAFTKR
jgi:predicted methyltransferase